MTISFQFFADAALTDLASPFPINHRIDGSGDPQDFLIYFGSLSSNRRVRADSNPGTDQIAVSIINATTLWAVATSKAVNDRVRTTAKNGFKYKCTVAGTTHATTEPTWPTTIGNTVADNTVTWQCEEKLHESIEVKLAATSGGLGSATAGAALNLGTTVTSGTGNKKEVHMRVDDATAAIDIETELRLRTNTVIEDPAS